MWTSLLLAAAAAPVLGKHRSLSTHWEALDRELGPASTLGSTTRFFTEQLVDHFAPTGESARYRQRYHVSEKYWCGSGCPVFVMIGGEGPQGPVSDRMFMATLAEQEGALMISVEHRFYGESRPMPDMSVESLRVLTSQQALADLASVIEYITEYDPAQGDKASDPPLSLKASPKGSPVVNFGGSYPGALSAWFRLKYPQLTDGAIASSAPVYAETNFIQYSEVVGTALSYPLIGGSTACFTAVESGISALALLVRSTQPYGVSKDIPKDLRPCDSIASQLDLSTYEANVFGDFQDSVQYNGETPTPTVKKICSVMTDTSIGSPLMRLAQLQRNYHPMEEKRCVKSNFAKDMLDDLKNETFDGQSDRQWIYQSCNEFGFFQTTESTNTKMNAFHAFESVTLQNSGQEICNQAFGITQVPDTHWSNVYYGGRNSAATNVVFVNGNQDPWHSLSIVNKTDTFYQSCAGLTNTTAVVCPPQRITSSERIVLIDGTAHCRDMYQPNLYGKDSGPIVWAHQVISESVSHFVATASKK